MERKSIALRRSVAWLALLSLYVHMGTALATDTPSCASGGRKGIIDFSVAALTSDGRLLCFKRGAASRAREIGYVSGLILKKDGYDVSTVQKPILSLADDVAATKRILAMQELACNSCWLFLWRC